MKINKFKHNEKGSVILLVLMVLVMLTVIGISALDFSTVETKIAHNDRSYKQNLFRAEAAVMEACELMNAIPDQNKLSRLNPAQAVQAGATPFPGLFSIDDFDPGKDTWNEGVYDAGNTIIFNQANDNLAQPQYMISFIRVVDGSEDGADFKRYEYQIYGRSTMGRGRVDVKAGYVMRF